MVYRNISAVMAPHAHGHANKDLVVLHETVSGDIPGWKDITSVEEFLASKDYGVHGLTDAEGNIAWARGQGNAVFWQAGGVNERSIGIEQVSNIMLRSPSNVVRRRIWVARNKQLRATAKLIAAVCRAHKIPIRHAPNLGAGICSHWEVSQHYAASEGHTDCWPVSSGGYYPLLEVIALARAYTTAGVRF